MLSALLTLILATCSVWSKGILCHNHDLKDMKKNPSSEVDGLGTDKHTCYVFSFSFSQAINLIAKSNNLTQTSAINFHIPGGTAST